MIVDAHVHLVHPERFRYPWLRGAPSLVNGHDAAAHAAVARAADIQASVFVEVDVAEDDAAAEAGLVAELPGFVGVVAAARPEHDRFQAHLDRVAHRRLVGVRRVLHVVDDGVSASETFRRNVRGLAERGLAFDLCVRADQLPLALALVRAAPDTRFVLDHGGNPPLADANALARWRDDVARLADAPQVACKISGLVNHVPPGTDPLTALEPVVAHLARRFGWSRLLFGSDWPVCKLAGFDLPSWTALAQRLVERLAPSAHEAVFAGNAARVYRLELPHA